MMVDRELTKLLEGTPGIEIVKIDVLKSPLLAWKNGVRMIPALKAGDKILSGVLLSNKDIKVFLEQIQQLAP